MRAFLRTSTSAASTSSSRVGQLAENSASCSVEQPAATFTTIADVKRWLNGPMASSKAPCLQNMRAAVLVLTKTPNPRQAEVRSLCLPWKVRQKDQQRDRPLATLITELQQAVISEGNKLCGSYNCESGAPASSVAQRSGTANEAPHHREETSAAQRDPTTKRCRLSGLLPVADNQPQGGAATSSSTALPTNSIEQLTATTTANPSMFKGSVEVTSAAQPGRRAKVSRQGALATIEEDTRDVRSLARLHDQETSASQPGPKTKQRRLTAMFLASDSQQAGSSASSSSSSLIPIEGNASAAQPGVTAATAAAAAAAATAPLAVPAAAGPHTSNVSRRLTTTAPRHSRSSSRRRSSCNKYLPLVGHSSRQKSAVFTSPIAANCIFEGSLTEITAVSSNWSQPLLAGLCFPQSRCMSSHESP